MLNNNNAHPDLNVIKSFSNGVLPRKVNNDEKKLQEESPDAFPKKVGKRFW